MGGKRRLLTEPQFRLLKRFAESEHAEYWAGGARDRAVVGRLERLDCLDPLGCKPGHWRITDHGRNILDLQREFFEQVGGGQGGG